METSWWLDETGASRNPFGPGGELVFTNYKVQQHYLVAVKGKGDFPIDMLRYDHAFCLTPIPHPHHPWWDCTYQVVVGFPRRVTPHEDRWKSFGWESQALITASSTIERLIARVLSWRGVCHGCQAPIAGYSMSLFSEYLLCAHCEKAERNHPDFKVARGTLRYQFSRGNYSFMGIHAH